MNSTNGRASSTISTASAMYPLTRSWPSTSTTRTVPSTRPTAIGMPTQPATVARCRTGTWSGTAALSVAYSPFWNALNRNQSRATPSTVPWAASSARQIAASTTMTSVQRCRRPLNRPSRPPCAVRSDSAPDDRGGQRGGDGADPGHHAQGDDLVPGRDVLQLKRQHDLLRRLGAIHMPRLARPRPPIQRYRTCWVGSSSAGDRTPGGLIA